MLRWQWPLKSAGEPGPTERSNKKSKQDEAIEDIPEEMEVQQVSDTEGNMQHSEPTVWATKMFPNQVQEQYEWPMYYMGEDEEEKYEGVDSYFEHKMGIRIPPKIWAKARDFQREIHKPL